MKISVFGVGYVGCVSAACLARAGHEVIGTDIDTFKVSALNEGRSPFFEPGLSDLIREMVAKGRLRATTDQADAVHNSDVALICVGTPTNSNGSIRLDYLRQVFTGIGKELKNKSGHFVVALRSTVLPTAIEEQLVPLLVQHSGKHISDELSFVCNPEFLREGTALRDFEDPPATIIGSADAHGGNIVAALYRGIAAPVIRTDPKTAMLVKYFSNAFHALKVVFANEAGYLCREMGVDSGEMMDIFCQDTKLNISARYLKPGFAFGGSCLPKDVKALRSEAAKHGLELSVLNAILDSNQLHLRNCIEMVASARKQRIGLVGLAFKAGTDDLRESPAVELAERLIGKGFDVRIYEPSIVPGSLHGTNLDFIERSIPHIWKLLFPTLDQLFGHAEVLVVMQQLTSDQRQRFQALQPDQICIDLARALSPQDVGGNYWTLDRNSRELSAVSY
jgi:GDP-mannose 6-dehydrogenase